MTDPQKDDHIEELLGKLQGIFGKLSHSEEEEAKGKIEIPTSAPKEPELQKTAPTPPAPLPAPAPSPEPEPAKVASPTPINLYQEPVSVPPPATVGSESALPSSEMPVLAPAENKSSGTTSVDMASAYESMTPLTDPEKLIVPAAVYFPPGRETEARSLAQKLETMAPKFTKVAFRLRVGVFMPYDPKSDWKETIIAKATESGFQAVFVLMDRPLEDGKRKAIAADLESRNVYFQEVTLSSVEKKAFYTDVLLGLVFFFDSRKPKPDADGSPS